MLLPLLMPSLLLVLPFPGPPQGRCCCGRLIVAEVLLLQGSLLPACSRLLATEQIQLPRNSRQLRFTARPETSPDATSPLPACLQVEATGRRPAWQRAAERLLAGSDLYVERSQHRLHAEGTSHTSRRHPLTGCWEIAPVVDGRIQNVGSGAPGSSSISTTTGNGGASTSA